ncbi:hypothetical protein RHGRI_032557 [Rhododendron griersonianum]|uniref:Uncharacterized protein n=1 Tax=Rhododendron griersonianum TaxID=479676 RepID=A0AAV6ICX4_9ERIC|nr:hypothetical protein RHGRI_032557 [Rhododendron griersonianum]
MVGRPVLALEIGTLFGDFTEFLVLCTIGAVFEREACFVFGTSVPFLPLNMVVSFQDALASSCPHFVEVLLVRRSRIGSEFGAVYYLRSSNDTVVRVGESTSQSTHYLQYIADVPFIKKYSVLFEFGEQFEWKKAGDFEDWLSSIINARPRFIHRFYHSANALPVLPTSPTTIPEEFNCSIYLCTTRCCTDNPQWCSILHLIPGVLQSKRACEERVENTILPSDFWEWSYLVDFGHVSGKQYKEQIATLEKCEERYKTVFADKISEFRRACCELFGYKVFISTLLLVLL